MVLKNWQNKKVPVADASKGRVKPEKEFNKLFEKEKKLLLEENSQLEEQFNNAEDLEQRLKLKEKIHRNEATIKDIDKELTNLEQYFERKS